MTGQANYDEHMKGKKHAKKLKAVVGMSAGAVTSQASCSSGSLTFVDFFHKFCEFHGRLATPKKI